MLRRAVATVLLFFYLLSIAGLVLHAHHCGNHLTALSLYTSADPCDCADDADDSCCKDAIIKPAKPAHSVVSERLNVPEPMVMQLPGTCVEAGKLPGEAVSEVSTQTDDPPGITPDVFRLRVLRI